jgi:2-oxo-3-hexenedioate decarboxylase
MYSSTVADVEADASQNCPLAGLAEPRIEPEIAFRLAAAPDAGMDESELFGCIDGIAHGFEVVQSIFPGWRFKAADTVAAFALHGRYCHRPFVPIASSERARWLAPLSSFEVALFRNGEEVDRGKARNVMGGGPLTALRHFVRTMPEFSPGWRLLPGHIVTTGTLTRAFPVAAGERWSTKLFGLPLPGMSLNFA